MKKSVLAIFLILTMLCFSGCNAAGIIGKAEKAGKVVKVENAEKAAEKTVNGMFTSFKAKDYKGAQKYINIGDIDKSMGSLGSYSQLFMDTLFDRLDYKIISSKKVDDSTVMVKTSITAVDMAPVVGEVVANAMKYAISGAFDGGQPDEKIIENKVKGFFTESASKANLATVTKEVEIKVIKTGTTWKVSPDDKFANALFGGLMDATKDWSDKLNAPDE